jgi:hypothetical protein
LPSFDGALFFFQLGPYPSGSERRDVFGTRGARVGSARPRRRGSRATKNGAPTEDFGTPPSGTISNLFNDHHVYSRPDHLKAGRVLTAIVRNNTILVPLRSKTPTFLGNLTGRQIALAYREFKDEFGGASPHAKPGHFICIAAGVERDRN